VPTVLKASLQHTKWNRAGVHKKRNKITPAARVWPMTLAGREKQMVVQDCWRNQREERRPGTLLGGRKSTWEIRWRMKTSRERRNFLSHTQAKDENFNPHSQRCWKNLIKERINQGTLCTQWSWPEQQLKSSGKSLLAE
jgi:hypothetical protein